MRAGTLLFLFASGVLLAACGAAPARDKPAEYLDENTGATVTVVDRPLVFAIERTDVAANVRDYLTLAAAAVDRSGRIQYVLVAYEWSTLDAQVRRETVSANAPLILAADDRRVRLVADGRSPHDMGIDRLVHPPPLATATPVVVATDLATLRFIAAASQLSVLADADPAAPRYQLWDDQRAAWRAFVQFMEGGQ